MAALPAFNNLAKVFSAMYVMEDFVCEEVHCRTCRFRFGFPAGNASRYLRGFGNAMDGRGHEFVNVLESEVSDRGLCRRRS